jgi:hypothetical protein
VFASIKYHPNDGSFAGCSIQDDLGTFAVLSSNDAFFAGIKAVNEGGESFMMGTRSFTNNCFERYCLQNTIIRFSAFLSIACV